MNARKLATIAALPLLAIAATVRADITSDLQTPDDQTTLDNSANLYSLAWRHAIDKYTTLYIDYAMTDNHADAHYDLGAGGHGVTTDCHDSTPMAAFDPTTGGVTNTGPHCFSSGRLQGVSAGVAFKF